MSEHSHTTVPSLVDTHVHLFDPRQRRYPWLTDVPSINRPYLLQEYQAALNGTTVDSFVFVEVGTHRVILQRLEAEVDELWSCVSTKANRHRFWIAMDARTRQVLAFHVGDRSRQSAQAVWGKVLPGIKSRPHYIRIGVVL